MYRTILVPLDGSVFAEEALPWAAMIASRSGAGVELAMVHEPPSAAVSVDPPREVLEQLDRVARESAESYLAEARERLAVELRGLPTRLLEGQAAEAIADHARPGVVDLVVMTTHGRGPVSRFWLGSVADRLVRRIGVPLLLVRPGRTAAPPGARGAILVPLDGSEFSESALPNAVALAKVLDATLELLHVVAAPLPTGQPPLPYPAGWDPQEAKRRQDRAQAYLSRLAQRLQKDGLEASTRVVQGLDIPGAILAEAEREILAIAIATHGERGVRRLVLGSVTDKVVRGASVPVLVTPPATAAPDRVEAEAEAALAR